MFRYRFLFLSIFLLSLSFVSSACGGFFCTNTPIDQNAERIIFTVNGDGTITAYIGITYVGEAEDFSWVLPVPSVPEVGVADYTSFNRLQIFTSPSIERPYIPCEGLLPSSVGHGGGGGGLALLKGDTGPYEYVVIGGESSDEIVRWLQENNYRVTDEMIPAIQHYVDEEMLFLAMRLKRDEDANSVQPVKLTYEAEYPMIPLILTTVAATEDMPIYVWIFADGRYDTGDYIDVRPDFSRFRGYGFQSVPSTQLSNWRSRTYGYQDERDRIQDVYHGRGFITEYSMPTTDLRKFITRTINGRYQGTPLLEHLAHDFEHVTRIYGQLSPDQMTLDPRFFRGGRLVDGRTELRDFVDPLHYYACSSREMLPVDLSYPDGRTYLEHLRIEIAHPTDWIHSTFTHNGYDFGAFAPVAVDASVIDDYVDGTIAQPVMLYTKEDGSMISQYLNSDAMMSMRMGLLDETLADEPLHRRDIPFDTLLSAWNRYSTGGTYMLDDRVNGFLFTWLYADEQLEENQKLIDAMTAYALSFQHYASRDYPHTLFLRPTRYSKIDLSIPFGDDWIEHTVADHYYVLRPQNRINEDTAPTLRIMESEHFFTQSDNFGFRGISHWAKFEFGLDDEIVEQLWGYPRAEIDICERWEQREFIPYDRNGKKGYYFLMRDFTLDVYTTNETDAAQYSDLLLDMLENIYGEDCSSY